MAFAKWIGVGAGWFFGGPIGAIIGYYIGKKFFSISLIDSIVVFGIGFPLKGLVIISFFRKDIKCFILKKQFFL